MICHWPHFEHPLEHHGLVMLVQLYNDQRHMLCTMESGQTEQDIILMSYTSTNYNVYNSNACTTLSWPLEHAMYNGVLPYWTVNS